MTINKNFQAHSEYHINADLLSYKNKNVCGPIWQNKYAMRVIRTDKLSGGTAGPTEPVASRN